MADLMEVELLLKAALLDGYMVEVEVPHISLK